MKHHLLFLSPRAAAATVLLLSPLFLASTASGQSIGDGIVTTAARTVFVAPTHAVVVAAVATDKSLDDVLTKVKGLDFTIEDLMAVQTTPGYQTGIPGVPGVPSQTIYNFGREVPIARASQELTRFRQFATQNTDMQIVAQLSGIKASDEAVKQAQQRAFADLYREAKARAEAMAGEAGLGAGRVIGVTDSYGALQIASLATLSPYASFRMPVTVTVRLAID